ncbi:MAG: ribosome-binding factor A [Gammaproteobacteria bacterium RIFCSPHIGHO2_12_FULL_35_23]|nr:MAG: ribosome-binding factor A [Gammaproteobacteria bacterium RIFCSPHIGHO2_12_FULL_35_23]
MKTNNRIVRVAQQIRIELAKIISSEIKDPRLGILTVTDVEVTRDFSYAKVYFVVRDKSHAKQSCEVLTKAAGFLRRCLAQEMLLRHIPQLEFHYDESFEYGNQIDDLLRKVKIQPEEDQK